MDHQTARKCEDLGTRVLGSHKLACGLRQSRRQEKIFLEDCEGSGRVLFKEGVNHWSEH